MKVGECIHLVSGFICTEGKYQNYPCPFQGNMGKCACSIPVTEKMVEQWNSQGYVSLAIGKK